MAYPELVTGTVSHLTTHSEVHGRVKKGQGSVTTSHKTDFRIDGRAAFFKGAINVADGDTVTLAGETIRGEFRAKAIKNLGTGVIYSEPTTAFFVFGGLAILASIPMMLILIGFLLLPLAIWLIYEGYRNQVAVKAVEQA